jgi:hypothetical protein
MGARVDSKSLTGVTIKNADKGEVSAVIATFNVIDKDGDYTPPGAFTEGQDVLISAYGHKSWEGALPIGKARIRTTKSEAIIDGQFFMDTTAGRDTFNVVKALGPHQQWSYGFDIKDSEPGTVGGQRVRILKSLDVHEASPVLIGAGVNTRTLATKSMKDVLEAIEAQRSTGVSEYKSAIRPHDSATTTKSWNPRAASDALGDLPSIVDLRAVHAYCDPDGDPELKGSYRFLHHDAPGSPANLRACLVGIGELNSAKAAAIPEPDRRGIYNHLSSHLEDGEVDAPALRGESGSVVKQSDELALVLADLASARERAWEVRKSRAVKGRTLGQTSVLLLEWITDELKAYRTLLDSPSEDAAREFMRFVQAQRFRSESDSAT